MKTLRPYQQEANDKIAAAYASGLRRLVFQLPTGGGKTLTSSALIHRFSQAMPGKKILFVVHRDELLNQFRSAIYSQYQIIAEPIIAGTKYRNPASQVYVTMVETANNRLRKSPKWFGDVGLVVIDECHIGSFKKLHEYFTDALIVGLSATPLSSSKKHPLKEDYEDIIVSTGIPDLIAIGALVPNRTYHIKNSVQQDLLKIKNGEFDAKEMFAEFSKVKHIENCVRGYEQHAKGTKTLIFNCNVDHSKMVTEAFCAHGYNAQHLDGSMDDTQRKRILKWFAETPDAILNNIGILTAGFDEPSVQTVIANFSTTSIPKWVQCTGRGSRPFPDKDFFTILDLGGNALKHGDWSTPRDWYSLFHNPPKPGRNAGGAAPIKECIECEAIIAASATVCSFCGAAQPVKTEYDKGSVEFELLNTSIHLVDIIQENKEQGGNPYRVLHQVKSFIVANAKMQNTGMNETIAYNLLDVYQQKVQEWCRENGKPYNQWHKETTAQWLFEEIKRVFDYHLNELQL